MIRRVIFLMLVTGAVLFWAWLNPPRIPEEPVSPRFVKIDATGQPIGAWQGPWHCVLDSDNGLLWEVKSYVEDLHDHQCSFSWFDGRIGVADGGSCFTRNGKSDTLDLIGFANAKKRCGTDGWRLPTERELKTLLSGTPLPGDLLIDRDYFPYIQRGLYWTSTAEVPLTGYFARLGTGAVSIDFKDGSSRKMPYRDAAFVRLVANWE